MIKIIRLLCFTILVSVSIYAQTDEHKFIYFPKATNAGSLTYFVGLSMAQLPTKIVEDVFDQVPTVELKLNYGLPYNFSAKADLNTNVLTNQLTLAPGYSLSYKNLSFGAGNEFLLWYGFFKSDGFDVSVLGWGFSPYLSVGYNFDDFLLSIKAEANIKAQNTYMKNIRYKDAAPKFVGFTFSLALEQPLWGSNYFAFGFRAYYTNFFYKSWLSFSSFDQYTLYPEFYAGFIF